MQAMSLTIRFWGVRGSIPAPGPATAAVGGNTSCVELRAGSERLILDAGTGLRGLGDELMAGDAAPRLHLLFSHVHWDHIQGFPFFGPVFRPGTELTLWGAPEESSLETALRRQMTAPSFPVDLTQLPSTLRFRDIVPFARTRVGAFTVTAAPLHHPGGVLGYRVEHGGRTVVYATDTEHYADRLDDDLVELARGADVLIYDSMYTGDEYEGRTGSSRVGWGHSTWNEGVKVARAAGVRRLVLFHHDPSRSDADVAAIERDAAGELPGTVAAREGDEISLDEDEARRAA